MSIIKTEQLRLGRESLKSQSPFEWSGGWSSLHVSSLDRRGRMESLKCLMADAFSRLSGCSQWGKEKLRFTGRVLPPRGGT